MRTDNLIIAVRKVHLVSALNGQVWIHFHSARDVALQKLGDHDALESHCVTTYTALTEHIPDAPSVPLGHEELQDSVS